MSTPSTLLDLQSILSTCIGIIHALDLLTQILVFYVSRPACVCVRVYCYCTHTESIDGVCYLLLDMDNTI